MRGPLASVGQDARTCGRGACEVGEPLSLSLPFRGEIIGSVCWDGLPVEGIAISMNCRDATACDRFEDESLFFWSLWLLVNVRMAASVVSSEVRGGGFAAQIAVGALVGDVVLAGNVFRKAVLKLFAWHCRSSEWQAAPNEKKISCGHWAKEKLAMEGK
jgi:hypothetical protein